MTVKVDETGMLHFDKITLAQKTKIDNFFGDPSYPLAPVPPRRELVRGLTSLPESNGPVGSLNRSLSVLSACSASPLTRRVFGFAESSNDLESIFRSRDGKAPSEKETEGSASEAADVETRRFGLSTAPSAAAESAFPEGSLPARADGWLRSEASPPRSRYSERSLPEL